MTRFEAPRGTHDILPSEQPLWQWVMGEMRDVCALYGYRRIDTPAFEMVYARIPMTIDLYSFAWAVRLDYFAEQPTKVTVSTDSVDLDLDLQQGLRLMQFTVNDSVSSFEVSAPADASPVCVTQVFVGSFGASDRSPFQ